MRISDWSSDVCSSDLNALRRDRRDAHAGIATAMAMGYAPMPSEPGRTSYALNGGLFRNAQAIGGAVAHRFATEAPLAVTAGFAYGGQNGRASLRERVCQYV